VRYRPTMRRFAVLVSGVDGLFWPEVAGFQRHVLAREGAEARWAVEQFGAAATLPFRLEGPANDTARLLDRSNIAGVLLDRGVDHLLLTVRQSEGVRAWARANRVRLLGTTPAQQQHYEDKRVFDALLRKHGLPVPDRVQLLGPRRRPRYPAVLQEPDSLGGEGTWFLRSPEDLECRLRSAGAADRRRWLIRELRPGAPYGVTLFVAPAWVAASPARRQCYGPADDQGRRPFLGIQWEATERFAGTALDRWLARLAAVLYAERFFGFANVDFLVDDAGDITFLECNPRLSAATPQLLRHPQAAGGLPLGQTYLRRPQRRDWPARFEWVPAPSSDYRGATLDLPYVKGDVRGRIPRIGRYDRRRRWVGPELTGETMVIPLVQPGDVLEPGQTVASLLTDRPLYDDQGDPLPATAAWLAGDWRADAA
jgi:hypothetical protein